MLSKFGKFLETNNIEVYDVAKTLRDSKWNQESATPRTREAFVRLLYTVPTKGWDTVNAKGSRTRRVPAAYNHFDGNVTAWRVAQELNCKLEELV